MNNGSDPMTNGATTSGSATSARPRPQSHPKAVPPPSPPRSGVFLWILLVVALLVLAGAEGFLFKGGDLCFTPKPIPVAPLPQVAVAMPLKADIDARLQFLGQFSAVDQVELRAQ